jgi:sporulation protein YlmC with PRC-barrel domain
MGSQKKGSPFTTSFRKIASGWEHLFINLTKNQIECSPSIDTHKPVSRQFEEEYYLYYGWPYYWQGSGLWGISGFPVLQAGDQLISPPPKNQSGKNLHADPHLRSTNAINAYLVEGSDGAVGHVTDFLIDLQSWEIKALLVKTGIWFSGEELEIPVHKIARISYEESKVIVRMTTASSKKLATAT